MLIDVEFVERRSVPVMPEDTIALIAENGK